MIYFYVILYESIPKRKMKIGHLTNVLILSTIWLSALFETSDEIGSLAVYSGFRFEAESVGYNWLKFIFAISLS